MAPASRKLLPSVDWTSHKTTWESRKISLCQISWFHSWSKCSEFRRVQRAGSKNEKAAQNLSRRRHLWPVSADHPHRDCPVRQTGCCWLLKRWCANSKMTQTQSWPFDIKDINENKCECAFGCLGLFLSSRNERGCALLACLSVIFCSVADDLPVSLHLLLSPAGCRALAEVSAEGCWDRGGPDPGEERRSGGTASTGMIAHSRNVKMTQHKARAPQGWDGILVCCQENRNKFSLNIWRKTMHFCVALQLESKFQLILTVNRTRMVQSNRIHLKLQDPC